MPFVKREGYKPYDKPPFYDLEGRSDLPDVIRCKECGKKLGQVYSSSAIGMNDNKTIERVEMNGEKLKRLEIKCPRCKELNEVIV